jgi:hypothetical protein
MPLVQLKPKYHGQDKEAAVKRAQKYGGRVIRSTAPGTKSPSAGAEYGFWSEGGPALIRYWETLVWEADAS